MSIIIFLLVIGLLVLSHEFGHFIVAKKSGMRVDEFGIGFPPKLFSWKRGETVYSINLFPIGGFVKILGEDGMREDDLGENSSLNSQNFSFKPIYQRALVISAGVFCNFILAWVLLSVGFAIGMPTSIDPADTRTDIQDRGIIIVDVQKGTPAERAGLMAGDRLVGFSTVKEVQDFVVENKGKEIKIEHKRNGEIITSLVTPSVEFDKNKGSLGIGMDEIGILKTVWYKSLWEGLKMTYQLTVSFIVGLFYFIAGIFKGTNSLNQMMGPVGIAKATGAMASMGFIYLLNFIALFSVNLAVLNLIPFPALDGGRLLFLLIEKIKGSPINEKFTTIVNLTGFALLIILMIAVTYNDILRLR